MKTYRKTKWLRFFITHNKPKTVVVEVFNTSNENLGQISWHGSWRQYIYATRPGMIYNDQCLKDIADVLTDLNREQKEKKA